MRQPCIAWFGLAELLSRQLSNQMGRVLVFLVYALLLLMIASLANRIGLNHETLSPHDATPPGARHGEGGGRSTSDADSDASRLKET